MARFYFRLYYISSTQGLHIFYRDCYISGTQKLCVCLLLVLQGLFCFQYTGAAHILQGHCYVSGTQKLCICFSLFFYRGCSISSTKTRWHRLSLSVGSTLSCRSRWGLLSTQKTRGVSWYFGMCVPWQCVATPTNLCCHCLRTRLDMHAHATANCTPTLMLARMYTHMHGHTHAYMHTTHVQARRHTHFR